MPQQCHPVLTLTLNPALDLSAETPCVTPGPKLRLSRPRAEPGGGGVNVARAVQLLGGEVTAALALGGAMGAQLADLLRAEGVAAQVFEIDGDTRHSLTVTDAGDGGQYRFVLPGPVWPAELQERLLDWLRGHIPAGALVVLSGSQPDGVAAGFPASLCGMLPAGARLIVDTSGTALRALTGTPQQGSVPYLLRMDQAEAEEEAGQALATRRDSLEFASRLVSAGVAQVVIVARGADGSVLVGEGLRLHCIPPAVAVVSKVGAGDSFTGAFTLALARRQALPEALQYATAAAAAAVMTPGTELCRPGDVERLLPECRVLSFAGLQDA